MLLKRQRKEDHRRREEERRRRMLQEATASIASTDVAALANVAEIFSQTQQMRFTSSAEHGTTPEPAGNFDVRTPKDTFFPNPRSSISNKISLPGDVEFSRMKYSPASSVSMSQSPAKNVAICAAAPDRKKSSLLDSDDSSDEEDLLKFAREKELRNDQRRAAAAAEIVVTASGAVLTHPEADAKSLRDPAHSGVKSRSFLDDDSESEGEDYLALAAQHKQKSLEERESATASVAWNAVAPRYPRNPMALQKADEEAYLHPTARRRSVAGNNELWSDSGDEAPSPSPTSSKKPKMSADCGIEAEQCASVQKSQKKKSVVHLNELILELGVPSTSGPSLAIISVDDEDELRKQLKPEFVRPKFGPYDPPLAFVLGGGASGENVYEVPASISRYLPEYQREGIAFMFNCAVAPKRGAILGDGECRNCGWAGAQTIGSQSMYTIVCL